MTKTSIKNKLMRFAGGREIISKSEIEGCMGWGDRHASKIIKDVPYIRLSSGKTAKKYYDVDDIAASIAAYIE